MPSLIFQQVLRCRPTFAFLVFECRIKSKQAGQANFTSIALPLPAYPLSHITKGRRLTHWIAISRTESHILSRNQSTKNSEKYMETPRFPYMFRDFFVFWFRERIWDVFWCVFWGSEGLCILHGAQEIANVGETTCTERPQSFCDIAQFQQS